MLASKCYHSTSPSFLFQRSRSVVMHSLQPSSLYFTSIFNSSPAVRWTKSDAERCHGGFLLILDHPEFLSCIASTSSTIVVFICILLLTTIYALFTILSIPTDFTKLATKTTLVNHHQHLHQHHRHNRLFPQTLTTTTITTVNDDAVRFKLILFNLHEARRSVVQSSERKW